MIKDQILFCNNTNFLQRKCFSCSSTGHIVSQCPLIHYIPDPLKIVKQSIKESAQDHRVSFERSRSKGNKLNSRFVRNYIQNCNTRFRKFSNNMEYDDILAFNEISQVNNPSYLFSSSPNIDSPKKDESPKSPSKKKLKINTNIDKMMESQIARKTIKLKSPKTNFNMSENWVKSSESVIFERPETENDRNSEFTVKLQNFCDFEEIQDSLLEPSQNKDFNSKILFSKKEKDLSISEEQKEIESSKPIIKSLMHFDLELPGEKTVESKEFFMKNEENPKKEMTFSNSSDKSNHRNKHKKVQMSLSMIPPPPLRKLNYNENTNYINNHDNNQVDIFSKIAAKSEKWISEIKIMAPEEVEDKNNVSLESQDIQKVNKVINKEYEEKNEIKTSSKNWLLDKEFERVFNFKNFYPDNNIIKIITIQNKNRIKRKEKSLFLNLNKISNLQIYHSRSRTRTKTKLNKVSPLGKSPIFTPIRQIETNLAKIAIDLKHKAKDYKTPSSIFSEPLEKKILKSQHLSFYDVVGEVLSNQNLRKRLMALKTKTMSEKEKTKYY